LRLKQRWVWSLALGIILLISLSRLYLGMHFLGDVVAGWVLGGLLVWVLSRWGHAGIQRLRGRSLALQIGLAFGAALIYLALSYTAITFAPPDPPQWASTAAQTLPTEQF